jgi:hypothetical protein
VIGTYRAGCLDDIDDLAEPDGRPRHGAHWLFF